MLREAGFEDVSCYGGFDGEELTFDTRLVLVASAEAAASRSPGSRPVAGWSSAKDVTSRACHGDSQSPPRRPSYWPRPLPPGSFRRGDRGGQDRHEPGKGSLRPRQAGVRQAWLERLREVHDLQVRRTSVFFQGNGGATDVSTTRAGERTVTRNRSRLDRGPGEGEGQAASSAGPTAGSAIATSAGSARAIA